MNLNSTPTVLVRTASPEDTIISAARGIFHDLAPEVPVKFSTFAVEMSGWLAIGAFCFFSWNSSPLRLSFWLPSVSTAWSPFS
jgi:hypothetical protein